METMRPPFPAYTGDEPYLFVCYSHEDSEDVYTDIDWLKRQGFNIWYDEGVIGGASWRDEVANALNDAHLVLLFLSPASAASSHCRKEVHYAIESKPFVIVELEETALSGGMKLSLADVQHIRKTELDSDMYESKLVDAIRVHVQHKTRIIHDQTIVYSDVENFGGFCRKANLDELEEFLTRYDSLAHTVTHDHGGVVRLVHGDSCLLTFQDTDRALLAVKKFTEEWRSYIDSRGIASRVKFGISRGTIHVFRSFVHGDRHNPWGTTAIDVTMVVCGVVGGLSSESKILVTNRVVENAHLEWHFERVPPEDFFPGGDEDAHFNRYQYRELVEHVPMYLLQI